MRCVSGAAVVVRQNRLIRAFREAGATVPERAVGPEELDCRADWVFQRMAKYGVFVETERGRYYLSEEGVRRFQRMRTMRMVVVLLLALLLSLVALVLNTR